MNATLDPSGDEKTGEVRWMTSFDTTEADVDGFASALRAEMATDRARR